MTLPPDHIVPGAFVGAALLALSNHVPRWLDLEFRRRTIRPLAICGIVGYGLLLVAIIVLA